MIGKRKRPSIVVRQQREARSSSTSGDNSDVFKQYFESRFEPLQKSSIATPSPLEDEEGHSETETSPESCWEGLSDNGKSGSTVEVIEQSKQHDALESEGRSAEFRSFMNSKVPREARAEKSKALVKEAAEEDISETINLKHDLDLQRLLKESHLLEKAKSSRTPGEQRHKATDMRLQSLGSQASVFEQSNMPLSHRRGIKAKATSKELLRRKEAVENGIVLEKASRSSKSMATKRDRGVDAPSVGRFRHGTLELSRHDIASIQGPSRGRGKRGRR